MVDAFTHSMSLQLKWIISIHFNSIIFGISNDFNWRRSVSLQNRIVCCAEMKKFLVICIIVVASVNTVPPSANDILTTAACLLTKMSFDQASFGHSDKCPLRHLYTVTWPLLWRFPQGSLVVWSLDALVKCRHLEIVVRCLPGQMTFWSEDAQPLNGTGNRTSS